MRASPPSARAQRVLIADAPGARRRAGPYNRESRQVPHLVDHEHVRLDVRLDGVVQPPLRRRAREPRDQHIGADEPRFVNRIAVRKPVQVEPPGQPDRVFLREVIPFDAVVRLCAAKSVCCPHLVARLSGYSVVRFVSRPGRAVSRGSPPVRVRRRPHGGQHDLPLG